MTDRDLDQAWAIVSYCRGDREAIAIEIAKLIAEIRRAKRK